jgi:uncharacterized protein with GYD domain
MYTRPAFRTYVQIPLEKEKIMASYLVQASYTSEAMASLIRNPQNRSEVVGKAVQNLGGKIVGTWLCFGDYDIILVLEMPDAVSAAAIALAAAAGGSLKSIKTTPLLTIEEGLAAAKKAASSGYSPVQK